MRKFYSLATLLVSLIPFGQAVAGELDIYEHNGSVINWFVVNGKATATYFTPKASLLGLGIQEGSVVFKGFEEGNRISGTAYTYRKGCPPAPYEVVGYFSGNNIALTGPSPVRAKGSCDVIRYTLDSPNAKLLFRYSSTHH
ncbi:hypothetical protein MRBLMR1_005809 [Neorhizobium sp. LMR1-1-1.1]